MHFITGFIILIIGLLLLLVSGEDETRMTGAFGLFLMIIGVLLMSSLINITGG